MNKTWRVIGWFNVVNGVWFILLAAAWPSYQRLISPVVDTSVNALAVVAGVLILYNLRREASEYPNATQDCKL